MDNFQFGTLVEVNESVYWIALSFTILLILAYNLFVPKSSRKDSVVLILLVALITSTLHLVWNQGVRVGQGTIDTRVIIDLDVQSGKDSLHLGRTTTSTK